MNTIKQLNIQAEKGNFKNIYPIAYIDGIIDKTSKEKLSDILVRYNSIYIPWQGDVKSTRNRVNILMRRKGLWITYVNDKDEIVSEIYKGLADDITLDDNWSADINWETVAGLDYIRENASKIPSGAILPDMLSPALQQLLLESKTITNLVDDEDLESINNVIKFKDKEYNKELASGLGRKILRKNWVNGKNILTQDMISKPNTEYIIQYDYNLNGETINIPNDCILNFVGGSFNTGTLVGSGTTIHSTSHSIFKEIIIQGSWNHFLAKPEWFGAKGDKETDDTKALQDTFNFFEEVELSSFYGVSEPLVFHGKVLKGFNANKSGIVALSAFSGKILTIDNDSYGGKLSNISLIGNLKSDGVLIQVTSDPSSTVRNVIFTTENCSFQGFLGNALTLKSIDTVVIGCIFSNSEGHGLEINNVGNKVIGCTSYFNKGSGFYITVGTNALDTCKAFYNGRIYKTTPDSEIIGAGVAIVNAARFVSIINVSVQQNYKHGFYIWGHSNLIIGAQCYADNLIDDPNGAAFLLRGTANYISATVQPDGLKDWGSYYRCAVYIPYMNYNNTIDITEYLDSNVDYTTVIGNAYNNIKCNGELIYSNATVEERAYFSIPFNNTGREGKYSFTGNVSVQAFLKIDNKGKENTLIYIDSPTSEDVTYTCSMHIYKVSDNKLTSVKFLTGKTLKANDYNVISYDYDIQETETLLLVMTLKSSGYSENSENKAWSAHVYPFHITSNNIQNYYNAEWGNSTIKPVLAPNLNRIVPFYNFNNKSLEFYINGQWLKTSLMKEAFKIKGTKTDRPDTSEIGFQFFDTSLTPPRPIWSVGKVEDITKWVDATGAEV